MERARWAETDAYVTGLLVPGDPALEQTLAASAAAGLPPHHVAPPEGKLLYLLALVQGAESILEIGTLGGYSTIWLARALPPGGRLVTLEADVGRAGVARSNVEVAGLAGAVEVRSGPALASLRRLSEEGAAPFDFVFIDADKPNNPAYLQAVLGLTRAGSVIVADNVVREGAVAQPGTGDATIEGVRRFLEMLATEPRVEATVIQTVGAKGHDGFALAVVVA